MYIKHYPFEKIFDLQAIRIITNTKLTLPNNAKKLALHLLGKSFKYCEIESLNFINEL